MAKVIEYFQSYTLKIQKGTLHDYQIQVFLVQDNDQGMATAAHQ